MCPVSRSSRFIIISSQLSMRYRGGCKNEYQMLELELRNQNVGSTFPMFCALVERLSNVPAVPNIAVSRPFRHVSRHSIKFWREILPKGMRASQGTGMMDSTVGGSGLRKLSRLQQRIFLFVPICFRPSGSQKYSGEQHVLTATENNRVQCMNVK